MRPSFKIESAAEDIPDPIYDKNDPINASVNQRIKEGSFLSIVKNKKSPFFYPLTLSGPGLKIE